MVGTNNLIVGFVISFLSGGALSSLVFGVLFWAKEPMRGLSWVPFLVAAVLAFICSLIVSRPELKP